MMNKIKIGRYLKNLRNQMKRETDGKTFSQEDLAFEFSQRGIDISINAIAEWESGATLPSSDNLEILSEIYHRSLDEILDGEDSVNVDYGKIYFLANPDWGTTFDIKENLYQIRNEQILLITARFKELLMTRIERSFSNNEENEFRFLFENFYQSSDYVDECANIDVNDKYIRLKDAMNELLIKFKNVSGKGKYWELQKLFIEKKGIQFSFHDVCDLGNIAILKTRFNEIENWQKDMLLAMFQNLEPSNSHPDHYGSYNLKRHEEIYGEYSYESLIKNEIKELIRQGACLNKYFLNIKKGYYETYRIIDRLEELYNLCLKPIEVQVLDAKDNAVSYKIKNNQKNRFLKDYYFSLKCALKSGESSDNLYSDIDEIYEWFISNDTVPEEHYLKLAKKFNIDITQDKKYWMADVRNIDSLEKQFIEFKEKEKSISDGLNEIEELQMKLIAGEKEYKVRKYEIIGGKDEESIRNNIKYWIKALSYSEYLKTRDKTLTRKLLDDLDVLSLDEIKEKYFDMEVIEDE